MKKFKKHDLFPTTVFEYDFRRHPDNKKLLEHIKKYRAKPHGLVENGLSSFTGKKKNYLKNFPKLLDDFQQCVYEYADVLGINSGKISHSWFNIMEKEGKTYSHVHRGAIAICIYYPQLEDDSCNIVFTNPLNSYKHSELELRRTPYSESRTVFPVKQNYLYICPGWIEHQTEVNRGGCRIVVSCNVYPKY